MSYDENYFYPLDPMPIDIAAIGFLYGQSNPNLQDDDYYWSNYELNNYRFSITDAGGNDSIILDNWNTGIAVNLEPNSWSAFSTSSYETTDAWNYEFGQLYINSGTEIENVTATNF